MVLNKIQSKIKTWDTILPKVKEWKANQLKIVFTNGCFDLLHYGHIHYLAQSRTLGDKLIVGVNSDASVSRLKGQHRPIKDEKNRSFILAALECVDVVVVFDEDTPLDLIQLIQPHILVKGGDWRPENIVGADIVLERGGKVLSLPYVEGYSTTFLEDKIKNS